MSHHEDHFIEYLGEQDGQLGASPGDALRRLQRRYQPPVTRTKGTQMDRNKKFYVGSNRMSPDWAKATLKEAVDHAKQILDKSPHLEEAFVVQVVRVVRRQRTPLVVERV